MCLRNNILLAIGIGCSVLPALVFGQNFNLSPTFAGHAAALVVRSAGGTGMALADTGPILPAGGQRENSLPTTAVGGVTARLLYAITLGRDSVNQSQASLAYLVGKVGAHEVSALWVEAKASASAGFLTVSTSGKSTLQGLVLDGQSISVTGEPNQTITLPDGYLVINEQSGSSSRAMGNLTVNALHLVVPTAGSLIAASATVEVINTPTRNTAR
jgi:hypothetical protein